MTPSDLSFVAKVVGLSGAIGLLIKYALPPLLGDTAAAHNDPALAVVVALLLAPSLLMGGIFWLRRSPRE